MLEFLKNWGAGKIPQLAHFLKGVPSFLKKPETRKKVTFSVCIILGVLLLLMLMLWAMTMVFGMLRRIMEVYGIYVIITCFILFWVLGVIEARKNAALERKKRQLAELCKRAEPNYKFLRNFLYAILSEHLCQLTALCRPLTPNTLTENPPFDLDTATGVLFFFYKVEKETTEPLKKGTGHVAGLIQSVITQRMETTGIEGICSASTDPLCSVIAIHKVEDLGSHVRITLVFDDDAYSRLKKNQGIINTPTDLIEHLR